MMAGWWLHPEQWSARTWLRDPADSLHRQLALPACAASPAAASRHACAAAATARR